MIAPLSLADEPLPPTVVISGPTAAGKTEITMRLADEFPIDLISADSAQVYRGMNVGTAKPDADTLKHYPHALIDIRDPEQTYSAADFVQDATRLIHASYEKARIPVLVGGTALYIKAIRYGLDPLPEADSAVRAELNDEAERVGWPVLHQRLAQMDPAMGQQIRPHDTQRIQRALEIHQITGRKPSELMTGRGPDRMPGSLFMVITASDRTVLHQRINQRWQQMVKLGLIEEVRQLLTRPGVNADLTALRAVGYRQTIDYLNGTISEKEWRRSGAAATRQLAKRQLTALRQFGGALWYDPYIADTMGQNRLNLECFAHINKRIAAFAA